MIKLKLSKYIMVRISLVFCFLLFTALIYCSCSANTVGVSVSTSTSSSSSTNNNIISSSSASSSKKLGDKNNFDIIQTQTVTNEYSFITFSLDNKKIDTIDVPIWGEIVKLSALDAESKPKAIKLNENSNAKIKCDSLPLYNHYFKIQIWALVNDKPQLQDEYWQSFENEFEIKAPLQNGTYGVNIIISESLYKIVNIKSFILKVGNGKTEDFTKTNLLPYYFNNINSMGTIQGLRGYVTSDNIKVDYKFDIRNINECIVNMNLRPYEVFYEHPSLGIVKPFTVEYVYGNQTDTVIFNDDKIVLNGKDYYPANINAIKEMYKNDYRTLLTKDFKLIDLGLNSNNIDYIEIQEQSMGCEELYIKKIAKEVEIKRYVQNLNKMVVRELQKDERPIASGGGISQTKTIYFKDGTKYSMKNCTSAAIDVVTADNKTIRYNYIGNSYDKETDDNYNFEDELPQFWAKVNGNLLVSDIYKYKWQGNEVNHEYGYPANISVRGEDNLLALKPSEENSLEFAFSKKPVKIKAHCARITGYEPQTGKDNYDITELVVAADNKAKLPNTEGLYYLAVEGEYENGFVSYAVFYQVGNKYSEPPVPVPSKYQRHPLSSDIDFTANDIEYIEEKYNNNDIQKSAIIRNRIYINKLYNNLNNIVVKLTDDSQSIGNIHEYTMYLKDGTKYTQFTGETPVIVTERNGKQIKYEFDTNKTRWFSTLGKNNEIPIFTAKINETNLITDEYNYQWNGNSLKYILGLPSVWHISGNTILNLEKENQMTFKLSQKPQSVEVYCKKIIGTIENTYPVKYSNNINLEELDDNTVILPNKTGEYYIFVKANYDNEWVEYAAFFEIK